MKQNERIEAQDKIPQTKLVDLLNQAELGNGEYLFDVAPDGTIKVSRLRKKDVSEQLTYSKEEFTAYLQHKDLDKGQYSVVIEKGVIKFQYVKKYWMNEEDF